MKITNCGTHYSLLDVCERLVYGALPGDTRQHAIFWLGPHDTVADLCWPTKKIRGPGRVEFVRRTDGGKSTSVTHPASTVIGAPS